jgi:hypothetical protein
MAWVRWLVIVVSFAVPALLTIVLSHLLGKVSRNEDNLHGGGVEGSVPPWVPFG